MGHKANTFFLINIKGETTQRATVSIISIVFTWSLVKNNGKRWGLRGRGQILQGQGTISVFVFTKKDAKHLSYSNRYSAY